MQLAHALGVRRADGSTRNEIRQVALDGIRSDPARCGTNAIKYRIEPLAHGRVAHSDCRRQVLDRSISDDESEKQLKVIVVQGPKDGSGTGHVFTI